MNAPLPAPPPVDAAALAEHPGYRFPSLTQEGNTEEILLVLAFSGGGKRSAAFSYGVLEGLRDLTFEVDGRQTRLLDQIDIITSVSGGSFTAAYYGLHRDRIFADYEADFLRRDIEGDIFGLYLLPWNWEWLVNPTYGTNDSMAEIYDDAMFHGATYADLISNGLPFINIAATNITNGEVFLFNQVQFDLLCSDLSTYPVARAVAASNGFPVLFTPITLESYAENCAGMRPEWLDAALQDPDTLSRRAYLARIAEEYLDSEAVQYVHLMDGGIADNLAMRGVLNAVTAFGGDASMLRATGLDRVRRIVIISADGQAAQDRRWAQQRTVTGIGQIFNLVSGTQIDRYNFETLQLARETVAGLTERLSEVRCAEGPTIDGHPCDDVTWDFLHVSLANIPDEQARAQLQAIPTGLTLPDEAIDLLVRFGRELILDTPELLDLRDDFVTDRTVQARAATQRP